MYTRKTIVSSQAGGYCAPVTKIVDLGMRSQLCIVVSPWGEIGEIPGDEEPVENDPTAY